jgi:hypothetical protein
VSSEESRTDNRDAMDAAVQHLRVVMLYLYFEEEGGHDPVICCSTSGIGMAPSTPGSLPQNLSLTATSLLMLSERMLPSLSLLPGPADTSSSRFRKLIALL